MYKKIIYSLGVIGVVGAIAISGTGAFFSDSETSTGNTFTAGDIDLQIDNESYVTNNAGVLVASPANSWAMSNLTNQLFFSFDDVKPGDVGEDTISVHVGSNDAWACMAADITATPENTLVDPETDAGDVGPALGDNGELQNFLNFTFWKDDGDNVYEVGESQITQLTGPAGSIFNGAWLPLADTSLGTSSVLIGDSINYIGKAWCFGTLALAPVAQDGLGKTEGSVNGPLERGTGVTCDGSGSNNIAQTDGVVVDVSFQAVQSRNNGQFLCSALPPFNGDEPVAPIVVGPNDLETNILNSSVSGDWYFYDDTTDVLNNALGGFVAGPGTPPLGTGSAVANPIAANGRTLLTNGGFGGTLLSTISAFSYSYYQPSGAWSANEAPFLRFNVDFAGSPAYQNSLVYVPSANGAITQNSWQSTGNMASAGAMWMYSGANWPVGVNTAVPFPGTTLRTWADILADYPLIKMHPLFPQVGMRVGEPGPVGLTANLDAFSITISGTPTTYNFDN